MSYSAEPALETRSFAADSLWNYELGLKQNVLDGRGFANISVYHINWSKIQLAVNVGGINQLVNGGDARVNGIDSSFSYRVLPDLNILAIRHLHGCPTHHRITAAWARL